MEIDLLYRMASDDRVIVNDPKTGKPEKDQSKALRERAVPDQTKRVTIHRGKRKPLPTFPDAHLIMPKVEVLKITPEKQKGS